MPNQLVRRSLLAVAASLSVAALAGCGATGGTGSGTEVVASGSTSGAKQAAVVREAAETTGAVDTVKVAVTVRTDPAGADPAVSISSTGAIDAANGRARVTAELSGTVDGSSEDLTIDAVYDRDTVYVKAPFTRYLGDTPWVAISSPKLEALADQLGGGLAADPDAALDLLEGVGGPVEELGAADVRGVPTRHVAVALDPQRALDEAPADRRQDLEDQLAEHGVDLGQPAPIPAEAWIDDDGFIRRFQISFDLAELGAIIPGADATGVITQTVELYDFDQPVDITVPPADQVTTLDLDDLFGGWGGPGGKGHGGTGQGD